MGDGNLTQATAFGAEGMVHGGPRWEPRAGAGRIETLKKTCPGQEVQTTWRLTDGTPDGWSFCFTLQPQQRYASWTALGQLSSPSRKRSSDSSESSRASPALSSGLTSKPGTSVLHYCQQGGCSPSSGSCGPGPRLPSRPGNLLTGSKELSHQGSKEGASWEWVGAGARRLT